jgi:hypothetical protein
MNGDEGGKEKSDNLRWQVLGVFILVSAVWTGIGEYFDIGHQMTRTSSSDIFPIALMEKFCDEVNVEELEASFATPEILIVFSLLAPAAFAALELFGKETMDLVKKELLVVDMAEGVEDEEGEGVTDSDMDTHANTDAYMGESADADGDAYADDDLDVDGDLGKDADVSTDLTDADTDAKKEPKAKEKEEAEAVKDAEREEVKAKKVADAKSKKQAAKGGPEKGAADKRKAELANRKWEAGQLEFKTFEKYQLHRTKKEVEGKIKRSRSLGFAVMHLILALVVLVDYTSHISEAVVGSSVMCRASKVLVIPLFKAFALSMWAVLTTVTDFVHWEVSRSKTPKEVIEQNLIPAKGRPLNRNIVTDVLVYTTAILLAVWLCAAFVVSPGLVGFVNVVLVLLMLLPMLILVLPLKALVVFSLKTTGVEELLHRKPELLLKIGLMQAFTTMMLVAWFGGVYYGPSETWTQLQTQLLSDCLRIVELLPAMLHVTLRWPTFSFTFELSFYIFACSIGMIMIEYVLKAVAWLDSKLGDSVSSSGSLRAKLRVVKIVAVLNICF